jgi:hypothetical protein
VLPCACQAEELGADLSNRRKSTVAAMLGRVQLDGLTQEQQVALLGPSPAARILDLLLSLPGSSDRLALLPDCFTAPEAGAGDSAEGGAAGDEETDELWCTPMQLLNEIDRRLNAAAGAAAGGTNSRVSSSTAGALPTGDGSSGSSAAAALPAAGASQGSVNAGPPAGAPEEADVVLRELRQHIQAQWLDSLPQL